MAIAIVDPNYDPIDDNEIKQYADRAFTLSSQLFNELAGGIALPAVPDVAPTFRGAAYSAPSAPAVPPVSVSFPSIPSAPAAATIAPVPIDAPPTLQASTPVLREATPPADFTKQPPTAPTLADPAEPASALPAAPTLQDLQLPDVPSLTLPTFDATLSTGPSAAFSYTAYSTQICHPFQRKVATQSGVKLTTGRSAATRMVHC